MAGTVPMKSPLSRKAFSPQQHKRNTSRSSTGSVGSNFLAEQYDRDRKAIIHSCFKDANGNQYMTHVRIIEDAKYPSSRPGNDSKLEYKKKRVLIVSSKSYDGKSVFLHKARENTDGSFQIGRTWNLSELQKIERDIEIPEGFLLFLTKKYYWQTNSAKERTVFIKTLVKIFTQAFDGHVPELINWDLGLFYLDEKSYHRALISSKRPSSHSLKKIPYNANNTATIKQVSEKFDSNRVKNEQTHNQQQYDRKNDISTNQFPPPQDNSQYLPTKNNEVEIETSQSFLTAQENIADTSISTVKQSRLLPAVTDYKNTYPNNADFTNSSGLDNKLKGGETDNSQGDTSKSYPNEGNQFFKGIKKELDNIPQISYDRDRSSYGTQDSIKQDKREEDFAMNKNKYQYNSQLRHSQPRSLTHTNASTVSNNTNSSVDRNAQHPMLSNENRSQQLDHYVETSTHISDLNDPPEMRSTSNKSVDKPNSDKLLQDLNALLGENIENSSNSAHNNFNENPEKVTYNFEPEKIQNVQEDTYDRDFNEASYTNKKKNEYVSSNHNSSQFDHTDSERRADQSMDTNDMSFEKDDEVRFSHVFDNKDTAHQYHEVDTIQEEEQINDLSALTEPTHKPIMDDKMTRINVKDEMLTEALSDINWSSELDANTLVELLDSKLKETEYSFNKDLLALQDIGEIIQPYEKSVETECSRMTPQFHVFLMELNNFAQDIQFVEKQNNGLQVESANKKLLWSTLSELLNTVSLDEDTLKDLLKCPIRERNLPWMEEQLDLLSKAIKAISGESSNEDYNLREMEAMKKRHRYYKKVTEKFLERVVEEMGILFANINNDGTSNEQLISLLQRLLVFSPLIAFCKEIDDESYNNIIDKWNKHILLVYSGIWNKMLTLVNNDVVVKIKSEKTIPQNTDVEPLVNQWNIFRKTRELEGEASKPNLLFSELVNLLNFIQQHCTVYQNFVNNFFHISSNLTFSEYVHKYKDPASRVIALDKIQQLDSNRESANTKMQMVSKVFQPITVKLSRFLLEICSKKPNLQPTIMLLLEQKIRNLESSNQEFLFTTLKRIFDQLHQSWNEFIEGECLFVERNLVNDFNKETSSFIYSFPIFVKQCQDNLSLGSKLCHVEDPKDLQVHSVTIDSYYKLSSNIVKVLETKNHANMSNITQQSLTEEALIETITLLINYNWLIEFLTMLNVRLDGIFDSCLRQCKKAFDVQKDVYSNHLLHDTMQKLKSFVDGAALMAENAVDTPANMIQWSGYSKQNLENILNSYSSADIKLLIQKLHKHMSEDLKTTKPDIIRALLMEKCWSSLQGQMVSLYLKLCTLIDTSYRGARVKFSKNDIIGNFEEFK